MFLSKLKISHPLIQDLSDRADVWLGKRNAMTPPKRMVNINEGDWEAIGKTYLKYLIDLAGLKPTDQVLDVGSGYGRIAAPLTGYLDRETRYEGLEIIPAGVEWCTAQITSRHPNFRFQRVDVRNDRYNPKGTMRADQYTFPFADAAFDVVFLTSVFTHMLPADLERYLSEIARVLKPGGRCLITYFLLNPDSLEPLDAGKGHFKFAHRLGECRIETKEDPEHAIAYPEQTILSLYARNGFDVQRVAHGDWSGRGAAFDFQDIVVARKR